MKGKKLLSLLLTFGLTVGFLAPGASVKALGNEKISDEPVQNITKQKFQGKTFTAKPLVVLMDFPDYKHTDLDTKETDFRINKFTGKETTPEFYESLFFGDDFYKTSDGKEHITVNKFFKEESGGSYEFKGKVLGWYTADHPAAYYGKTQEDAAKLTREAIDKVVKNNPDLDLSQFDVEDKWDIDHDGNYDEPDGIIDTVVVIHAGLGEEWGGGSLKEDAIWPFRIGFSWYDNDLNLDKEGEKLKQKNAKSEDVAYRFKDAKGKEWFSEDFTIFEQDLPVDLFNHEYGHVLGLPDLYGDEPPVENWSIMGGSYTGDPRGSQPVSYGAYCRQYLQKDFEKRKRDGNWQKNKVLDLKDIDANGIDVMLDQATLKGNNNDCVRINLPQKEFLIIKPFEGKQVYFSGKGDKIENFMKSKEVLDLTGKKDSKLTFKTWYAIDPGFDFASVMVKEEGSDKWVPVKGNITTTEVDDYIKKNEKPEEWVKRNPGHGITEYSKNVKGADSNGWVDAEFDLSQFAGKKVQWGFRFKADANTPEQGIYIDTLKVTADGQEIFNDNAEGESKFNFEGFKQTDGIERNNHYYLLEWRNSKNGLVDQGLDTINIGRPGLKYNQGLVVWYINEKYAGSKPEQKVYDHPGELFAGIVDANQNPVKMKDGDKPEVNGKINYQMHDSAFSLRKSEPLDIKWKNSSWIAYDTNACINPSFNDGNDYTANYNKNYGLKLENYGLKFLVAEESSDSSVAKIHIMKGDKKDNTPVYTNNTLKVNKTYIKENAIVVEAEGNLGNEAYIGYTLNKNGKINKTQFKLELKDGKYVANLEGNKNGFTEKGEWKVDYVILNDKEGRAKSFYNSKENSGYGMDLSASSIESYLEAEILDKGKVLEAGEEAVISAKFTNTTDKKEKVSLILGLYDENGKLVKTAPVYKDINSMENQIIESKIQIPSEGKYTVKAHIWTSSKGNKKVSPVEFKVQ